MISVAMATYNGGRFIRCQIESILNQTLQPDEIVVCDDGSTDDTVTVVREMAEADSRIHLYVNEDNLGPIQNFAKAMRLCKGDYISLSDQDDVWDDDKLAVTLSKLLENEKKYPGKPVLVHSDLRVVDENLSFVNDSFWRMARINPGLLGRYDFLSVRNCVTGNTAVFNRIALDYVLPIPDCAVMHDHWIALCVAKYGYIDYVNRQTVSYRRHSANVVPVKSLNGSPVQRIINLRRTIRIRVMTYCMLRKLDRHSVFRMLFFIIFYRLYYQFVMFGKRMFCRSKSYA